MTDRCRKPNRHRVTLLSVMWALLSVVFAVSCGDSPAEPAPLPPPTIPVRPELAPLWALYESTNGPQWHRRDHWLTDAPVDTWHGVTVDDQGRVAALNLRANNLSGEIPPELGDLAGVELLALENNDLAGRIPRELGDLGRLQVLRLNSNNLAGAIPPELGRLTQLHQLELSGNPRLGGRLPSSLTALDRLRTFGADGTGVCAPADPIFQAWIRGVSDPVPRCLDDTGPSTVYLTQAVQSRSVPVPLVADRPALLRVFVTARDSTAEVIPPVRATFYMDGVETYTAEIPPGTVAIPTTVYEGLPVASANAEIPGEVIRPGLELVVEIDPEGTLHAALGVGGRIPKRGRIAVDVREVPVLDLTLIPFLWTPAPDSAVIRRIAEVAADPERHWLLHQTRTLLPVPGLRITAHDPVLSLSNDAHRLLSQTSLIRLLEPGRGHYMGMMSGTVTGPGGLGQLPGRASFAEALGTTVAHELGHNMSLRHAPCGDPPGVDPEYPHADGTIGSWGWGYDFGRPGPVSPSAFDLMAYCPRRWISGFHFTQALLFRIQNEGVQAAAAAAGPVTRSLLLWGGVEEGGEPFLEPAFVVEAPPALPEPGGGAFKLAGRTAAGDVVFSLSFDTPEIADADGASSFAFVVPVETHWAGDLAAITLSGPGGTATLDGDTDRPMVILRNPRTGQVRAFLRDPPPAALAGSAVDVGALSPERGLEALFSRGLPAPREWRR